VILVSEGATVMGVLAAETIIVLGSVGGILSARNITVAKTALVEGEVYYQTMSIDPQAQCDVQFTRLGKGDDPVALGAAVYDARMSSTRVQAA
jgi:cytoskeletal protein CcmA (bactofilin family)